MSGGADVAATSPARALAAAIRSGELGSRELLETFVERIERLDGELNAVVTFDLDRARAACDAADADTPHAEDRALGPLHGLPVTIKDAIEVGGVRSTGGAVELCDHVPASDAPVVRRLREAGAIVFAKTNVPRWSGDLQTFNEIFGTTNNPWDTTRTPGGSSGGPAVAVACGFTSFEIGTDIGGSVRTPSHFCGTFGLKTSFGVVSQRGYLDRVGGGTTDVDINVFGPMARSADDLDLLLDVIAGPDEDRAVAWQLELPAASMTSVAGVKVAVWPDEPDHPIDPGYRAVLRRAVDALADAGAVVEEARPPASMAEQVALYSSMIVPAIAPSMPAEVADAFSGSVLAWQRLEQQRAVVRAAWAAWFAEGWDVLLCPVTPTPAFPHDQVGDFFSRSVVIDGASFPYMAHLAWAGMIGNAGLPSAVPPLGRTADGLPVGVQVVAPFLHDRTAVRMAGLIAEVVDGAGYVPPPLARS